MRRAGSVRVDQGGGGFCGNVESADEPDLHSEAAACPNARVGDAPGRGQGKQASRLHTRYVEVGNWHSKFGSPINTTISHGDETDQDR